MKSIDRSEHKAALILRLKRIEGQLRGIQRLIEEEAPCESVAQQLSAARRALDKAHHTMVGCLIESQLAERGVAPAEAQSLVDLAVTLRRGTTRDEVADAFRQAARGDLAPILGVEEEELVSSDFIGETRSAVVDLPLLQAAGDRLFRVVAWYDNEYGYTHRLAELLGLILARGG